MTGQLYLHPWGGWPYLGTLYKHLQFTIPSSMQECPHLLTFPIHPFMLLGNQHFINAPLQVHFFVTLMDFWLFSENVKRVSHDFLLNQLCISCSRGDSNSNYSTKLKDSRGFLTTRDDRFKDQLKAEEVCPNIKRLSFNILKKKKVTLFFLHRGVWVWYYCVCVWYFG